MKTVHEGTVHDGKQGNNLSKHSRMHPQEEVGPCDSQGLPRTPKDWDLTLTCSTGCWFPSVWFFFFFYFPAVSRLQSPPHTHSPCTCFSHLSLKHRVDLLQYRFGSRKATLPTIFLLDQLPYPRIMCCLLPLPKASP